MTVGLVILAGLLDATANYLAAHYLLHFGPFAVPAGTFLFALSFTVADTIRRLSGRRPTVAAIALGFLVSLGYQAVAGGSTGRIAVAGLVALAFSGTADYLAQSRTLRWPLWRYVAASNAVSLAVDSVVFTLVAFAGLPWPVLASILAGQYLAKLLTTAASIPLVYGIRRVAPTPAASGLAAA